jgi:hypothetical protein
MRFNSQLISAGLVSIFSAALVRRKTDASARRNQTEASGVRRHHLRLRFRQLKPQWLHLANVKPKASSKALKNRLSHLGQRTNNIHRTAAVNSTSQASSTV